MRRLKASGRKAQVRRVRFFLTVRRSCGKLRPHAEKTALKLGDGKVASSLFSPRMIGDSFKQGFSGPLFMWVLSGLGTCCPSCSFGAIFLGHLCLGDQEPGQTARKCHPV